MLVPAARLMIVVSMANSASEPIQDMIVNGHLWESTNILCAKKLWVIVNYITLAIS